VQVPKKLTDFFDDNLFRQYRNDKPANANGGRAAAVVHVT